jgi:uncharacterized spore protein YtfJ
MNDVNDRMKTVVEELDKLLDARNVCGEPITIDGATVVPLVSYGFGFGGGSGSSGEKDETGGGFGAGGGIKVAGVVVIDEKGARVETLSKKGTGATAIGDAVAKVVEAAVDKKASRSAKKSKSKEAENDTGTS